MELAEFKSLDPTRFSKMSLSELEFYRIEADKLIANMTTLDPVFMEQVVAINNAIAELRG